VSDRAKKLAEPSSNSEGFACPLCAMPGCRVLDSRPNASRTIVRRRRQCVGCSERFTTYESVRDPEEESVAPTTLGELVKLVAGRMGALESQMHALAAMLDRIEADNDVCKEGT